MITAAPETKTIKAAQGKDYGEIDEMISVEEGVLYPSFAEFKPKQRKDLMIVKTHAASLACGDCRVLSGKTRELQGPPSFPYIPGGDCCGVVVEIPEEAKDHCAFQVGDRVAARFVYGNRGAIAEYAIVHQAVCEKVPDNITSVEAAALAGACPATLLAERINEGERVLILGAGGGVGSHTCQVMRSRGASFLAGVSRTPDRLLLPPLKFDKAIDYTKEDPFAIEEFKESPFDVVLDLAGGGWPNIIKMGGSKSIVKPASKGGRYLTTTPDEPVFEIHSIPGALKLFMMIPLWRAIKSRLWGRYSMPKYTFAMSLPAERSHLTRTFEMAAKGTLKAVVDPRGPFPFTTEGVRKAFHVQESRHGHGKVIIDISKEK